MSTTEFVVLAFFVGAIALILAEIVWNDPRALREMVGDSEDFARRPAPAVARVSSAHRFPAPAGFVA